MYPPASRAAALLPAADAEAAVAYSAPEGLSPTESPSALERAASAAAPPPAMLLPPRSRRGDRHLLDPLRVAGSALTTLIAQATAAARTTSALSATSGLRGLAAAVCGQAEL